MDRTALFHDQSRQVYSQRASLLQTDVNALRNTPIGSEQAERARQSPTQIINEDNFKGSHESDDSFSAYIEHPIKQSTPPRYNNRVHEVVTRPVEQVKNANMSRDYPEVATVSVYGGSCEDEIDEEEEEGEEGDGSWPSMIDHGEEEYNHDPRLSHSAIVIPDMQEQDEDDYDMNAAGEKKRRRRTNKSEANVLASVCVHDFFSFTQQTYQSCSLILFFLQLCSDAISRRSDS